MQKSIRTLSLFVASVLMGQSSVYSYSCVGADHNLHSKIDHIMEVVHNMNSKVENVYKVDSNKVTGYENFIKNTYQGIVVGDKTFHPVGIDLSDVITPGDLSDYPYIRFENNTWYFVKSGLGPVSVTDGKCAFNIGQALTNETIPGMKSTSDVKLTLTGCQAGVKYNLAKIGYNPKNTTEPWEFVFYNGTKYASVKSKTFLEDKTCPETWGDTQDLSADYNTLDANASKTNIPFGDYTINYDSTAKQLTINKDQASGILYTSTHKIQSFAVDPKNARIMINDLKLDNTTPIRELHCVIIPELVK